MPAPTSASVFLEYVRKSGLLDPADLNKYLADIPDADALPPAELAQRMARDGLLTPFQASHLLKGRYKNFLVGNFKVLQPLGHGGMSQVYLCEHAVMKHRVALKLLPAKESKDPAAVSRFVREARAAAAVNHPHVVRAHDFHQSPDGKFYYLIMDYVDGVNLHDLVKKIGPLPPARAANYVAQAALGLQHIFECGLVHRDLKPGNLLLDRAGVVKILDLGLARFTGDDEDKLTQQFQNNAILGTADYLAPEQALQLDVIDVRADVYSLGATLYFLLSGEAPFETATVAQKLLAHQMREPPPIPGLPAGLQVTLFKMMAKNPADRFQTPIEVAEALAPWANEPLPPPDESYFPPRPGAGPTSGGARTTPPVTAGATAGGFSSRVLPGLASGPQSKPPSSVPLPPFGSGPVIGRPATGRRRVLLAAGIGVALLAAAGVAVAVWRPFAKLTTAGKDSPPTPTPVTPETPPGVPPPAGSLVVGPGGFATVAAALAAAKPGSKIVLTAADHAETLAVARGPKDVIIQGWPDDRPPVWRTPDGAAGGRPPLTIVETDGLTVSNVHFDGRGTAAVLVEAAGRCPALKLDGVQCSGFRTAGVRLAGCEGDPARPVTLSRLRATGGGEAGVAVAGGRHLLIDLARFEEGLRAGVRIDAPVDGLTVRHVRFAAVTTGVAFGRDTANRSVAAVVGNTFFDCGTGLVFDTIPAPAPRVEVKSNLFMKTRLTARCPAAEAVPLAPESATWVWHDEELPKAKEVSIPAGVRYFRKVFDLTGDPPADAVLDVGCVTAFKAWVNGTPVGESDPKHFTKRVYAFPVGKLLKPGRNVIAVQGTHTLDPINPGFAVAAGLTVRIGPAARTPVVATDDTWKSSAEAAGDWTATGYDDAGWKPVKVWAETTSYNLPWNGAVWDSYVRAGLKLPDPVPFAAAGNVRDYHSQDTFPLLNSLRGFVPALAGTDPADDATYLRTPRSVIRLYRAGADGGPVGVPTDR